MRRDPPEKRKEAALETLAALPAADIEGYTDGSVLDPRRLRQGGGGYTLVDARRGTHRGLCAAGRRCTSYRAELAAMLKLLDDLIAGRSDDGAEIAFPDGRRGELRIALDSQSAIVALARGASAQTGVLEMRVWERLVRLMAKRNTHITVQYVPGHVALEEQERADVTAKEAARDCEQDSTEMTLALVRSVLRAEQRGQLRETVRQHKEGHLWLRATAGKEPKHDGLPRALQRTLAQLRAGRSVVTHDIRFRFSGRVRTVAVPKDGRHGMRFKGRVVTDVAKGSGAGRAGIRTGEMIEKVGGVRVDNDAQCEAALR
eukprot:gene19174-biopygen26697